MSTPTEAHNQNVRAANHPLSLFSRDQVKALAAMILMATGLFFALAYAGLTSWSSPWWVMYLAIPSLMLLFTGSESVYQSRKITGAAAVNLVLGLLGVTVSIIMVKDPTWSFIRIWDLDRYFPSLRKIKWDPVWQWMLVVLGTSGILVALRQRVLGIGVLGALLVVIGGTFLLDLSWDSVWPLIVVALGAGLLLQIIGKN